MRKILLFIFISNFFLIKAFAQPNPQNIFYHQIDFSTTNQNMWGEGSAFSLDLDYTLIGNPAGENGLPIDIYTNLGWDSVYDTEVAGDGAGLNFGIGIYLSSIFSVHGFTGGSVDIEYPATITVDYPDHCSFFHGQTVPIQTSLAVRQGWDLTSHFPSGGIVSLDFEYGFIFNFAVEICIGGCDTVGFDVGYPGIGNSYNTSPAGVPYDSIALFYINTDPTSPNYGLVAYPCVDNYGFPTICQDNALPINIPDILDIGLTGEINIPYVTTSDFLQGTCLIAEGDDMWAWFNFDVLQFLDFWTQFIPPPYGTAAHTVIGILNGTFDIVNYLSLTDNISIDYYILQINLYMQTYLHQRFEFCPTIEATFTFPTQLDYTETNGSNVIEQGTSDIMTIDVGNNLNITYPCYGWDSMEVASVHYHLVPTFSNHTWNEFRFFLLFDIIYFNITIDIDFGLVADNLPGFTLPSIEENDTNETIVASNIELNEINFTPEMSEDTVNNPSRWSTSFCLPPNCQPLLSYTWNLGSINLDLFPPFWDPSLGTWLIGGWNLTDTTFPGTWLYPKDVINIQDTSHLDIICYGDTTGLLTTTVGYGTCGHNNNDCDPYSSLYAPNTAGPWTFNYSWQPTTQTSNTTTNNFNVPAGYYYVTVNDVFGCTTSTEFEVFHLFPEIIVNLSEEDALCYGTATGNLYSEISGGDPPYTWNWSPLGSTVQNPIDVYAGWYYLTLFDNQGCERSDSIYVDEPSQIVVLETITNVTCFGFSDGSISISVSGGISPYTYSWSNGSTSNSISNLVAGVYTVTVTDNNGCTSSYPYNVIEPALLQLSTTQVDVLCYGENTGSIDLMVSGGVAPYIYTWSNGATTQDLTDISSGNYTVTVVDNNLCEAIITATITQPTSPLSLDILSTHNICFGDNIGSADLTVQGGIPPYSYSWSNGANTEDIFNLIAGTYTITITDDNGCTLESSTIITEPPQIQIVQTIIHVSCFGLADGSISISVSDGNPPYSYQWSTGATGILIENLIAGVYYLTVTDDIGCIESRTYVVNQPAVLDASGQITDVLCYGESTGMVNLIVTGGTFPYSFVWSNSSSSEDLINVPADNYSVTVIDAHSCSLTRNFQITQPTNPLTFTITSTNVICFGEANGTAGVIPAGGVPPYSYSWSNGETTQNISDLIIGEYHITVTDANGCDLENTIIITEPTPLGINSSVQDVSCYGLTDGIIYIEAIGSAPPYSYFWNDGSILATRNNLGAGTYTITITDSHGCSISEIFVVNEPSLLQMQTNVTDIACFNQSTGIIDIAVIGGYQPYQYQWSNGEITEDLINVLAGIYYLTITDANNCQSSIMATVNQPSAPLNTVINATNVRCFGEANGTVDLVVTGGTSPYLYQWNIGVIQEDLENLSPGIYTVTVTDNNYCSSTAIAQITQATMPLSGEISGTGVNCNGESTGTVYTSAYGGIPSYSYMWSNGSWSDHLENVSAGTYTVTVTDSHLCHYIMHFEVTEPEPYFISTFKPSLLCKGMSDEIGLSLINGNNPPYTIEWSNATTEMSIEVTPTQTTTYTVTITDTKLCQTSRSITVDVIDTILLEVTTPHDTVCANTDVAFFVHTEGGGKNDKVVYINGQRYSITIPIFINVQNDTSFVFEVSDTCEYNTQRIIKNIVVKPNPPIAIESDKFEGCSPLTVQFYETSYNVGQNYLWNFDDGDIENLSTLKNPQHCFYNSKTFLVHLRVESDFGCVSEADYPIQVFSIPHAAFTVNSTSVDIINPSVEFYDNSSNGYYYYWTFGDNISSTTKNPQHSYSDVGEYLATLKITTMQGCVDTTSMKINVSYSSLFYAPTAFSPNRDGLNDKFVVFLSNYQPDSFEINILDRFGEVVYKSNNVNEGWNGIKNDKLFPVGAYSWIVKYKDLNGNEFTKVGVVTLLK